MGHQDRSHPPRGARRLVGYFERPCSVFQSIRRSAYYFPDIRRRANFSVFPTSRVLRLSLTRGEVRSHPWQGTDAPFMTNLTERLAQAQVRDPDRVAGPTLISALFSPL